MRSAGAPLEGKTVVLGVCGGIAAYKAVEVCRRLSDAGSVVLPVLTREATRFVGPLTFSALAAEPARVSLFAAAGTAEPAEPVGDSGGGAVPHIDLARRADFVLVAPATARLLGSYAGGISSDLLTATLLATRAPVLLCPSMHTEMWEHPAVQDNVALLRRRGVYVLEPDEGRLAGGDVGKGRLPEPERIVEVASQLLLAGPANPATAGPAANPATAGPAAGPAANPSTAGPAPAGIAPSAGRVSPALAGLEAALAHTIEPDRRLGGGPLAGVKAVVSAGGTREPLDPVRYIGNRSSGKQGYAVATELLGRGAEVTLVSTSDLPSPPGARLVPVDTAEEMAAAVLGAALDADVVVMAAAVADYRPRTTATVKLKKSASPISVELVPTLDILAELGARRRPGQVIVGFAAETASAAEAETTAATAATKAATAKTPGLTAAKAAAGAPHATSETSETSETSTSRLLAALGRSKLEAKGADLIVANDVGREATGFGADWSEAVIVSREQSFELGLVDKRSVASKLADFIESLLQWGAPASSG